MNRLLLLGLLGAHFGLVGVVGAGEVITGAPVGLQGGDRVVLVGSALIEREAESGYLETRIARRYPGQAIVVRNLGWTGDTVDGITRGKPNPPTDGFAKLVEHVTALKPTVIVLGYGANEAFGGAAGLPTFQAGLDRLWNALSPTQARFVVLTPTRQAQLGPPLPDPAAHNADLERYGDILLAAAAHRGATAVDLGRSNLLTGFPQITRLMTSNGLHLTPTGYYHATALIAAALDPGGGDGGTVVIADGQATAEGASVTGLVMSPTGMKFEAQYRALPVARCPGPQEAVAVPGGRHLRVAGLAPGRYLLKVDGRESGVNDAEWWQRGCELLDEPEGDQVEALRHAIIRKNLLYFHRWRPQNETYLFGFRKHEQGRNAAELAAFDPLIAAAEAEIVRLSQPVPHTYELVRVPDRQVQP